MYFCNTKKQRYNRGFKVNGFLAQLVEQWIENPCVPGSIPGETTKKICKAPILGAFLF